MAGRDETLLRYIFENGPQSARGLEVAAGDVDQFDTQAAEQWARDREADGLVEPSAVRPSHWQITDAGRRRIGDDPAR